MISTESLIAGIRREFAAVPFPLHCGLHAAMARDDWVDDEVTLAEITKHQDFIGEWWNVPAEHLQSCMMALSYLDAGGMIFYLPAFMTALIERPEDFDKCHRSSSWQVAFTMLPEREDPKTAAAFLEPVLTDGRREEAHLQRISRLSLHECGVQRACKRNRKGSIGA